MQDSHFFQTATQAQLVPVFIVLSQLFSGLFLFGYFPDIVGYRAVMFAHSVGLSPSNSVSSLLRATNKKCVKSKMRLVVQVILVTSKAEVEKSQSLLGIQGQLETLSQKVCGLAQK